MLRANGKSISAEVLPLLAENVVTPGERARREEIVKRARTIRSRRAGMGGPFPTAEELQRGDRAK
jgi:hypothetical protein